MVRKLGVRATLLLGAIVLGAGCESAAEPTQFTPIKDRAEYKTTTSQVDDVLQQAVEAAMAAAGGRRLNGADRASDTICDPIYGRRYRELEAGGTFVVDDGSVGVGAEQILGAWKARGWDAEAAAPDTVRLTHTTSTGVAFSVRAELRAIDNDSSLVGVSLSLLSDCLELPDDVMDAL
ncbi:MAG: hypothetical protein JWR55_2308 [Aeromicrobium sp.]|nr:hypothetical protein [Aeromicrobium sp.]